jgi:hypothetical protein
VNYEAKFYRRGCVLTTAETLSNLCVEIMIFVISGLALIALFLKQATQMSWEDYQDPLFVHKLNTIKQVEAGLIPAELSENYNVRRTDAMLR